MKKRAIAIFSALVLIAIIGTASLTPAQSNYTMRVTIPFDFAVGDNTYSSGPYSVAVTSNLAMIQLSSSDCHETAFITSTIPLRVTTERERTQLEFSRYGDKYFLRKVWLGSGGYQLPKSRLERELIENRSEEAARVQVETVVVTPN